MQKVLLFTIITLWTSIASLKAQVAPTIIAQDFTKGLIGINIDAEGNIWATEHGTGNDDGRITIVSPSGAKTVFMTGLPSTFIQASGEIVGSYRIHQLSNNKALIVVGEGDHPLSETILTVDKSGFVPGSPLTLQNVESVIEHGDFIHGLGFVQSNPFHVDWDAQGNMYIADAGANSIVKWDVATGALSIVKTFPPFPNPLPFGPPMVDPVPTKALSKPDGTFFVSQLTGFPFVPGGANVYNLDTQGNLSVHAEGFTCLTDMAYDPADGNLCVMQFGVFGEVDGMLGFQLGSAAVIKLMPDGSRDTLAQGIGGLAPSFAFDGNGNLYVADLVFGQILKYSLTSSTPEKPLIATKLNVFPNPASEQVSIEFELTREASVKLDIYDLSGRLLVSRHQGSMPSGKHILSWDGAEAAGRMAPNGTYMFRIMADNAISSGLISLVRP